MLPSKVRVKLLSEAAGYITVSHVVQRDYSVQELVGLLLSVVGSDMERIQRILQAGSISSGEYRYRWEPLEIEGRELGNVLETLPHAEPARVFQPENAVVLRFRHGQDSVGFSRESAGRKPLFARQSFWDALVAFFREGVRYLDYSHADGADVFAVELDAEGQKAVQSLLPLLKPKSAAARVERLRPERIEWLVRR